MSEDARQEIEIELGGETYRARPTFQIIVNIEAALDQPARTLGLKCWVYGIALDQRGPGTEEIKLTELAIILFHMIGGPDEKFKSPTDVGDVLMEEGYGKLCLPVGNFLTRAQQGNREHLKEIERKARKAKSPPEEGSKPIAQAA